MSTAQTLLFFGIIALTTVFTRALAFVIFPEHKETPRYIQYLGKALPYTIIGLLVVYCLKEVSITVSPFGLPEAIAVAAGAGLHLWRKNMLLSIAGGTVVYMVLVQFVLPG